MGDVIRLKADARPARERWLEVDRYGEAGGLTIVLSRILGSDGLRLRAVARNGGYYDLGVVDETDAGIEAADAIGKAAVMVLHIADIENGGGQVA